MTDYSSTNALNDFVHTHKLIVGKEHLAFNALVNITTEQNTLRNRRMFIRVRFDGYDNWGTLSLAEDTLDTEMYPTLFDAKYQTFVHVDDEHLLITGFHSQNPMIGKYKVKIIPLS